MNPCHLYLKPAAQSSLGFSHGPDTAHLSLLNTHRYSDTCSCTCWTTYRLALHGVLGCPGLCPFSPQEAGTGCPGSQSPSESQPSSLCFPKFGILVTFTFLVKSTSVEPPQESALNWVPRSCSKIRVPSLKTSASSWEMAPYCTHLCPQFLDTSLSAHTVSE